MQVSLVFEYALWNNSLLKWLCSVQHCGYGGVLNLVWKAQWFAPSARGWGDIVWWDSLRVLGLWRQLCHVSLHPLHYTPPHTISVLRILYVYHMYVPWNWIIFCILGIPEHMILASTAHNNNMVQHQIEYYTSFLQCPTCEKVWVRYYFSMKIQFVRFFRTPSLSLSVCL